MTRMKKDELESVYGKMRINNMMINKFRQEVFLMENQLSHIKKSKIDPESKIKMLKDMEIYHGKIQTFKRDIWDLENENKVLLNVYRGRDSLNKRPNGYKPIPISMEDMMICLSYLIIDFKLNKKTIKRLILLIDTHNPNNQEEWMKGLKQYVLDQLAQESLHERIEKAPLLKSPPLKKGKKTEGLLGWDDV